MNKKSVAVLISGNGSNLQALIDAAASPDYPAKIVLVISNKEDAPGLKRAKDAKIPTKIVPHKKYPNAEAFDDELHKAILTSGADFICLAGFMRLLTPGFVTKWEGRMINIHPSLLPSFKGLHTHEAALNTGVKIHGCSVHFVVPEMDSGPIIIQAAVPVLPGDTAEMLGERVLGAEHQIYPYALKMLASGKLRMEEGRAIATFQGVQEYTLFNPDVRV